MKIILSKHFQQDNNKLIPDENFPDYGTYSTTLLHTQ